MYCVILRNLRKKLYATMVVVLCNSQQFSANCTSPVKQLFVHNLTLFVSDLVESQ